ncbi:MAG: undecaprenyldiphospho-muramoylpentapeptide beta-N-acetylglucosaminyltransferase [Candidatus Omnitrophica bacterium]|nr:undecaprenyldiphospho-muramoylpentapeptide beta-N-acetylglucosaminyltransferase [Candidatus Omnitrophota bacterium]
MKILIAAGGSGGHIFPAIALARELEKEKNNIVFVASRRKLDKKIMRGLEYKKVFMSVNPMPYKIDYRIILFMIKSVYDFILSIITLIRFRPRVVVGFGGYTGGSVVFLAAALRIKTVVHEQNVIPGRTNRLLGPLARKIAVSFPGSDKYFKSKNTVFTGNPLREESLKPGGGSSKAKFGLDNGKFTILVMGGSQGASSLNRFASVSIGGLLPGEKNAVQVLHITGQKDEAVIRDFYEKHCVKNAVFSFIDSINEAYSASDIAISRAGASAIFELATFGKPMILVPYPSAGNNQRFNALFLAGKDAAIYEDEKTAGPGDLRLDIRKLLGDEAFRRSLSENARKLIVTDGAKRLAKVILEL